MPRDDAFDPLTLLPDWVKREKSLTHMLPYVTLVDDATVRTRGNELFQCIRLEGVNSSTTDDDYLDRTRGLFASIISQIGPEFAFYVHKVSKAIDPNLAPITGDDFAAAVDRRWTEGLLRSDLRDKTLTLTVMHRPPLGSKVPFSGRKSMKALRDQTEKRMRRLGEVVGFLRSTFASMSPRLLSAEKGELLGFLGGLNTGQELPLYRRSKYGYVSDDVSNTRVTFRGRVFEISDG
ncbi:MAG: type IV secretion system protein B4, partial [Jannaschia sp.]